MPDAAETWVHFHCDRGRTQHTAGVESVFEAAHGRTRRTKAVGSDTGTEHILHGCPVQQSRTAWFGQLRRGSQGDCGVFVAHNQGCRDGSFPGVDGINANTSVPARQARHFEVGLHRPMHWKSFPPAAAGKYWPCFRNLIGIVGRADDVTCLKGSSNLSACFTVKPVQGRTLVTFVIDYQLEGCGGVSRIQGETIEAMRGLEIRDARQPPTVGMAEAQKSIAMRSGPITETANQLVGRGSPHQLHRASLHHSDTQARSYGDDADISQR